MFSYMRKKGGPIDRVPLNKWAGYRAQGYEFVENGAAEFAKQNSKASEEAADQPKKKKKVSKKSN
jgi:hypothetical protein